MVLRTIHINQGQCLRDVAIQHCGDVTALIEIAQINSISPTAEVPVGTALMVPDPYNKAVVEYLQKQKAIPATEDDPGKKPLGGIGYMGIGIDFKTS